MKAPETTIREDQNADDDSHQGFHQCIARSVECQLHSQACIPRAF